MGSASCTTPLSLEKGPPEWVQLIPLGDVRAIDGRRWQCRDAEAVIRASLPGLEFLYIDFNHAAETAHRTGGPAPAAGWIKALAVRDGFLCGQVEWTPRGAEALANREYRFISPVFTHDKEGTIVSILGAGLTNRPALRELAAVASTEGARVVTDQTFQELCTALGLPVDADVKTALARAQELAAQVPDPRAFVPRAEFEALLAMAAAERQRFKEAQIASKIRDAELAGKVVPATRDWAMALCSKDEASFDDLMAKMPPLVPLGEITSDCQLLDDMPAYAQFEDVVRAVCTALGIEGKALRENLPCRT